MANFEIKNPPEFSDELRKFEVTDKAHADLFNAIVEVLINNDAFLEAVAEDYNKIHKENKDIHITSEERDSWNKKAETDIATDKNPGLLSSEDKTKLDGIAEGANKYTHPTTDGSKHVPATGNESDGKLLMAGSTSGNFSWKHPSFSQATSRENISSGEKLSVSLGKIMKFFADVISKSVAFMTVVNNGTTTAANTLLDGRMGKTLLDKYNALNSAFTAKLSVLTGQELTYINDGQESYAVYTPPAGYVVISAQLVNAPAGYFGIKLIKVESGTNKVNICLNWGYSGKWATRIFLIKL